MNIGKATAIFLNINDDKYTSEEKGKAIYLVLKMPTHNGITKDKFLEVVAYLFNRSYTLESEDGRKLLAETYQARNKRK